MALTIERIRADVADVLGEEAADVPIDENLVDHGLDSARTSATPGRRARAA